MKLLTDLVVKCFEHGLDIDISSNHSGVTEVKKVTCVNVGEDDSDWEIERIAKGYIKDPEWRNPEDELIRMHKEVDAYLDSPESDEEPDETESARAKLTEYERKMKEAGHKEGDFA